MANQSMVSTNHDDLCNWEFVNHFDDEFDNSVIVVVDDETVYDLVESFDSFSSTSSLDQDQWLEFDHDVVDDAVDDGDDCSRVSDLVENRGVSNCDENDGVGDYFNGSRSILYGHDDGHVDFNDDDNCSRVSDLVENYEVSNCVVNHVKNDGFVENFNGSSSILHGHDDELVNYDDNVDDDIVDGDDDDDGGYGYDDELIPWEVTDRLMRQRIRKSGKNSIGRLAKSKKSALVFTRPGCVRGKHGLGLKVY